MRFLGVAITLSSVAKSPMGVKLMLTRESYLPLLGIERWRLRGKPIPPHYYRVELYENKNPVGLLLADAILKTDAEKALVLAIAKSTAKNVQEVSLCSEDPQWSSSYRVVILLGQRIAQRLLKTQDSLEVMRDLDYVIEQYPALVSYSAAELLNDKSLKAVTWKIIQKAMGFMSI